MRERESGKGGKGGEEETNGNECTLVCQSGSNNLHDVEVKDLWCSMLLREFHIFWS